MGGSPPKIGNDFSSNVFGTPDLFGKVPNLLAGLGGNPPAGGSSGADFSTPQINAQKGLQPPLGVGFTAQTTSLGASLAGGSSGLGTSYAATPGLGTYAGGTGAYTNIAPSAYGAYTGTAAPSAIGTYGANTYTTGAATGALGTYATTGQTSYAATGQTAYASAGQPAVASLGTYATTGQAATAGIGTTYAAGGIGTTYSMPMGTGQAQMAYGTQSLGTMSASAYPTTTQPYYY